MRHPLERIVSAGLSDAHEIGQGVSHRRSRARLGHQRQEDREYIGRVAVRVTGSFNIQTVDAVVQGVSHKYFRIVQRGDGYGYAWSITHLTPERTTSRFPPIPWRRAPR